MGIQSVMASPIFRKARSVLVVTLVAAAATVPWGGALAGEVTVAVAANFTAPAGDLAAAFEARTGYHVDLSFGSTGQLYTQITQGAPFDILLSADSARPAKAVKEGWGVEGTQFTYAIGKLVLWSPQANLIDAQGDVLKAGTFTHLAVANPVTAPYGAAAMEVMTTLGILHDIEPKLVTGENIAQTYQFVTSGNAELGFVALSQVVGEAAGSRWIVPESLYTPIRQDAVLLKVGEQNTFAKAFLAYLKEPEAVTIIKKFGYGLPSDG